MAMIAQPPYWGVVLQNGSHGPDVALVQRWLNGIRTKWPAIHQLTVDGAYGSNTEAAVQLFQALTGLTDDGEVGPNTWNQLYTEYQALFGPGEIYPGIPMESGQQGATVKSAQTRLKATVPTLVADGVFGSKTKNAVMAYQTTQGLAIDGIIGTHTWASLYGKSVT